MIGDHDQVLRQAVRIAGDCEGMSLRLNGRSTTPEAYIRRARRLLAKPRSDIGRHITLCATVPVNHHLVSRSALFGMTAVPELRYGKELVRLEAPKGSLEPDWGAFFRAVEPFIHDETVRPGWLGEVWGLLPSS